MGRRLKDLSSRETGLLYAKNVYRMLPHLCLEQVQESRGSEGAYIECGECK